MTTRRAEELYRAQHNLAMEGKREAVFNPHDKPLGELPVIYGFNNGGSPGWFSAVLLAEDGTCLGGHTCSHEGYMWSDLGILEGTRPDRHETFREHYPDGYRMAFITQAYVHDHEGLTRAIELYDEAAQRREGE
jgi:hypothetical protein